MDARPSGAGWTVELDSAFDCPDFTISLRAPQIAAPVGWVARQAEDGQIESLAGDLSAGGLLPANAWRQDGDRVCLCFDLRRGRQLVHIMI
jgi:hypothetical protein